MLYYFERLDFSTAVKVIILKGLRKLIGLPVDFIYSQHGEDLVFSELFKGTEKVFYVDVGCNNPVRFSNTFLMYLKGGNGLAIDGNEKQIKLFKKYRRKDVSIQAFLSKKEEEKIYYEFESDLTNTIDYEFSEEWKSKNKLLRQSLIKTTTLNNVLDTHLPKNQIIDFLNIDVEGMDYEVISSLDLNKYRPQYICIEIHELNLDKVNDNEIYVFLKKNGYEMISHVYISSIFKDNTIG